MNSEYAMTQIFRCMSRRGIAIVLTTAAVSIFVSGCTSSRFGSTRTTAPRAAEQLRPIASSSVQTQSLPPLGGTDGQVATATASDGFGTAGPTALDPTFNNGAQQPDGSFVSLNDLGVEPNTSGRDLSGSVTVAKMLGSWTIVAGADRCRLNLTQTSKTGTNRYRASTPGCKLEVLSEVASWQLAGSQLQLYNASGAIIGSLLQSGNRFIGTIVGGVAVSLVG